MVLRLRFPVPAKTDQFSGGYGQSINAETALLSFPRGITDGGSLFVLNGFGDRITQSSL